MEKSLKLAYTCAHRGYKWAWNANIYKSICTQYLYMYTCKF